MNEKGNRTKKERYLLSIGQRVKAKRDEMGLTQEDFADKYGYARTTLAKLEAGLRDFKSTEIIKIAYELDVSCDYLLGRERESAPDDFVLAVSERLGLSEESQKSLEALVNRKAVMEVDIDSGEYVLISDLFTGSMYEYYSPEYNALSAINALLTSNIGLKLLHFLNYLYTPKIKKARSVVRDIRAIHFTEIIHLLSQLRHTSENDNSIPFEDERKILSDYADIDFGEDGVENGNN